MVKEERSSSEWPPRLVVCVGAVVLHGNRALFVRQAEGHPLQGQWSIPWGFVDQDEALDAAALRETMEESGVEARVDGLLGIQQLHQVDWFATVFLCHHFSGTPKHDGGVETDQAAYFSIEEMESFEEPFEPWCEWLVRRTLGGECHIIPPEPKNPYRPLQAYF
jgi:ADP-ribose pyrophosphatase YjhB (NUDIX family)